MALTQAINVVSLARLRDAFRGPLILPGDSEYDSARVVWNAIADRRPAIVARCTSVDDVTAAIRFARENDLRVAVRGGGHSVGGFSTCDGGIVIDLSGMREVRVDPGTRTAHVQGGALLAQLDRAAQEFGLACPVGVVGHTGVGGLTLGGGMGRLQRRYGFTIDNILSLDLVTADGEARHVSEADDPELFWGMRGAGANFGVVTSFELRLHPVGPNVTAGSVAFPIARAREVAAVYREAARSAPDHMHLALGFAPATSESGAVVGLGSMHSGDQRDAERELRGLRREIEPLRDTFGPTTYLAVQTMSDEAMGWGKRFYMKGAFVDDLSDALVDRVAEHVARAPGDCSVTVWAQGGATARASDGDMAFSGRSAAFWLDADATWTDKERDADHISWGRSLIEALKPFTAAGVYVNTVVEEGSDIVARIYGDEKYGRLRALKRKHDPDNVFRLNQNIRP
jgi:FAD/FMN-containing dehydrogenase